MWVILLLTKVIFQHFISTFTQVRQTFPKHSQLPVTSPSALHFP